MKKLAIIFIGFFLIAFSMNVNAQGANSDEITDNVASATIIAPLELTKGATNLNFGNVIPDSDGGTVIWNASTDARTATNGITLQPGVPGTLAAFNLTGLEGATYAITFGAGSFPLTGPTNGMTVSNFNHDSDLTLDAGESFEVGATLNVPANASAGDYQGTYTVTVTYQ
jgi:hypothetical protein